MRLSEPGGRNDPVTVLESYDYRSDTGGAGRNRGGAEVGRAYRFTAPSTGICLVYKT